MTVKTRFAPSPTGKLHVGNARVALLNWLFTKQQGGQFLLRLDDTDSDRSRPEFADGIRRDLTWLGLNWDAEDAQSNRLERYQQAKEQLLASGHLYPCYETQEELELKRKVQLNQGKPPLYDRAALHLTETQKANYAKEGRIPHWRFQLAHEDIQWHDIGKGEMAFHGAHLSDPVLFRADGKPIYSLASVVDDIDHNITHVLRGEDHVTNTALQIQVCRALGGTPPHYGHLPLLVDASGQGLSKRTGSLSLESLREETGLEAMAINSLLARLGSSQPVVACSSLPALQAIFDIQHFGRATPKFDPEELRQLNAKILHDLSFDDAKPRLQAVGASAVDAAFWEGVKANLMVMSDIHDWWHICHGAVTPVIEDSAFIAQAASLLPPEPWTSTTWSTWVEAVKQASGRKGKALFMPLRLALTGQEHGPELADLLPLIGFERARQRLLAKNP